MSRSAASTGTRPRLPLLKPESVMLRSLVTGGLEIIFAEGRAGDGTDPVRHVAPFHPEKMAVDVP